VAERRMWSGFRVYRVVLSSGIMFRWPLDAQMIDISYILLDSSFSVK
jgi:hypothetical protein